LAIQTPTNGDRKRSFGTSNRFLTLGSRKPAINMLGLDFASSMRWISLSCLFFLGGFLKLDTENPRMVGFHK
jgi:hypothetical protein